MVVVVAEKFLVARALAKALFGEAVPKNDVFVGDTRLGQTHIGYADGHVLGLAEPHEYDPSWMEWRLEALPIVPAEFNFALAPRDSCRLNSLDRLLRTADHVVNACDAAREGELIFDEIARWSGLYRRKVRVQRLWINDTTENGLRRAWQSLRDSESAPIRQLREQARTHSESDWLWGINFSRYASLVFRARADLPSRTVSVGRVRTPVLGIISERCHEVHEHRTETFFQGVVKFQNEEGQTCEANLLAPPQLKFGNRDMDWGDRAELIERIEHMRLTGGTAWTVIEGDNKPAKEFPPAPFELTDLQRTASRLLSWSPRKTERIAQSLYAKYHAITYPRTDCWKLPESMRAEVLELWQHYYDDWLPKAYPAACKEMPRWQPDPQNVFADAVTDHHAIIPTRQVPPTTDPRTGATTDEYVLWDLIVRRFLSAWLPPGKIFASSRVFSVPYQAGEHLRALVKAAPVIEAGWLVFEDLTGSTRGFERPLGQRMKDEHLPPMAGTASFVAVRPLTLTTHPPELFTYDTLLQRMSKFGLGTQATRGALIEELQDASLVVEDSSHRLSITEAGERQVALLRAHGGEQLLDPKLTAFWETQLENIDKPGPKRRTRITILNDIVLQIRDIGTKLTAPSHVEDVVFCPKTGLLVGRTDKGWRFQGWPEVECPAVLLSRKMKARDYRDIFAGGRTGAGPYEGFVSRNTGNAFRAWIVFEKKTGRFKFSFRQRRG